MTGLRSYGLLLNRNTLGDLLLLLKGKKFRESCCCCLNVLWESWGPVIRLVATVWEWKDPCCCLFEEFWELLIAAYPGNVGDFGVWGWSGSWEWERSGRASVCHGHPSTPDGNKKKNSFSTILLYHKQLHLYLKNRHLLTN